MPTFSLGHLQRSGAIGFRMLRSVERSSQLDRRAAVVAVLFLTTSAFAASDTIQVNSAVVTGRVTNASGDVPVPGAVVTLQSANPGNSIRPVRAMTASRGEFVFESVPHGDYVLRATKAGFLGGAYGQLSPVGQSRVIHVATSRVTADLRLWSSGVIAGQVLDDFGDPVAAVGVQALERISVGGRQVVAFLGGSAKTNDRGEYRIEGLAPGIYAVAAPMPALTRSPHLTVLAPGSPHLSGARLLSIQPGDVLSGINIVLPAPGHAAVTGSFASRRAATKFPRRVEILSGATGFGSDLPMAVREVEPGGTFTFAGLPPGSYRIRALAYPPVSEAQAFQTAGGYGVRSRDRGKPLPPLPIEPTLWAEASVSIEENVRHYRVELDLHEGARIRGRIQFESESVRPGADVLNSTLVLASSADDRVGEYPAARIEADGSFYTVGFRPGKYTLSLAGQIGGFAIASIMSGGQEIAGGSVALGESDVTDVVIYLSKDTATVSGVARDDKSNPLPAGTVYLFPRDRRWWVDFGNVSPRMRTVPTEPDGSFSIRGLLPGDYWMVATPQAPVRWWMQPDILRTFSALAVAVRITKGSKISQNLIARSLGPPKGRFRQRPDQPNPEP
jgi:protocatechuate 3,4-dioxygenase beta subunit